MKFLVISTSGLGELSVTYNCAKILTEHPSVPAHCEFDYYIYSTISACNLDELVERMTLADVIIFAGSPGHMSVFGQYQQLIEALVHKHVNFMGKKAVTAFTTSMRLGDNLMHHSIQMMLKKLNCYYIPALSLATNDMLNKDINLCCISQPDPLPPFILEKIMEGKKKGAEYGRLVAENGGKPPLGDDGKPIEPPPMTPPPVPMPPKEDTDGIVRALNWLRVVRLMVALNQNKAGFLANNPNVKPSESIRVAFINTLPDPKETSLNLLAQVKSAKEMFSQFGFVCDDINLADYPMHPCDSCKFCYKTRPNNAPRPCKFDNNKSDKFRELDNKLADYQIHIYVGNLFAGLLEGGLHKIYMDRTIVHGFYTFHGWKKHMGSRGFIVEPDDLESYAIFKEWTIADNSFGLTHFLGISTGDYCGDSLEMMCNYAYSLYVIDYMRTQLNFYSEKTFHHFADLGLHIEGVDPGLKPYFTSIHAYEPITLDVTAEGCTELSRLNFSNTCRSNSFKFWVNYKKNLELNNTKSNET